MNQIKLYLNNQTLKKKRKIVFPIKRQLVKNKLTIYPAKNRNNYKKLLSCLNLIMIFWIPQIQITTFKAENQNRNLIF